MKTRIFFIIVLCAFLMPVIHAQTVKKAYLGIILLQNSGVVDIFSIDREDEKSIFHSGGLRSLNKKQMEELLTKLRSDVIRNKVGGDTKLFDGAVMALNILAREAASIQGNVSFHTVFVSDGFDTASKRENSLAAVKKLLSGGIGGRQISTYSIAVSGKGAANADVLKAFAQGKADNHWNILDEALTQKRLFEIAQPASGEIPVIFFVIDQSGSLKSNLANIEKAVETTVRALFEKADDLVGIPEGRPAIGSPSTEPGRDEDETLFHPVVSAFYLSPFLFTQREYEEVWGADSNPSAVKGADLPVTNVSWYQVARTLNELSVKGGFTPAYVIKENGGDAVSVEWDRSADGYYMPTEIQWEYACRAGTTSPFYTGASLNRQQANIKGTSPSAAGAYPPNGFGIYDMIGNVREWVWDVYGRYPNDSGDVFEAVGNERVTRGGSYANRDDAELRSAYRTYDDPRTESPVLGFRVARNIEKE
jgi:formylglycine-generating enzyme required for sulfatase activity